MRFRAITISGEVGSGKSSIVRELLKLLPDWTNVNTGKRFRAFCESKGMSIQQVATLPDSVHREFDADQQALLAHESGIIVEGRLAGWLAHEMDDVFRVWCQAPVDVRVLRVAGREKVSKDQALQDLEHRDLGDLEKYRRVYGLQDYRLSCFYHLVLDTSRHLPNVLAKEIFEKAGLEE